MFKKKKHTLILKKIYMIKKEMLSMIVGDDAKKKKTIQVTFHHFRPIHEWVTRQFNNIIKWYRCKYCLIAVIEMMRTCENMPNVIVFLVFLNKNLHIWTATRIKKLRTFNK